MITLKATSLPLIALLFFGFISSQAQEQATETNSLKPGAWALQFAIGQNFTLMTFQGAIISAKYHTSATNALRAGISITGNSSRSTGLTLPTQADTLTSSVSMNSSASSQTIELRVQYMWYLNPEGITHFYTGLGPSVSFAHFRNDREIIYSSNFGSSKAWDKLTGTDISNSWSVGASAMAGVEYFPSRFFSLHAEYGIYLIYRHEKGESTSTSLNSSGPIYSSTSNSTDGDTRWSFDRSGVNFGLSVYF